MVQYNKIPQTFTHLRKLQYDGQIKCLENVDLFVGTSCDYIFDKLLAVLSLFDGNGKNCPGSYYHSLIHLIQFTNKEPEEHFTGQYKYTKSLRKALFLSIITQVNFFTFFVS